ncbi:hypothetical protein C8Q74DRAFT_1212350 [Fomes fomentarius]|nr:hypothetical protein C8Q74DRAFT_1212350 [Fomes fomentarius]
MVDWQDPAVVAYNFFLYEQIAVFLLGFYGTAFVHSLNVEWELITRRRAFRVIHGLYLLARYITLAALLFFVITGRLKNRIACDSAYRTFASLGSLAAMLASLILGSRPAAIFWTFRSYIPLAFLGVLALGQAFLVVLQGITVVHAIWDEVQSMCIAYTWDTTVLAIFYFYTFAYDVVILLLTLYAVRRVHREQMHKRWGVGDILCIQGIGYVLVTCLVNVPVAVLAILDLNAGMDVLLSLPAMTFSVIASSFALLSLDEFGHKSKHPKSASRPRSRSRSTPNATGGGIRSSTECASGSDYGTISTHIPMTSL